MSKITFRKMPNDSAMKFQMESEIDLFCTEDINKETPRYYNDHEVKNYFSPNYTDRLHTVEEVCSSSKESSIGGDYQVRSFIKSTSKREPLTSSVRAFTEVINRICFIFSNLSMSWMRLMSTVMK
jgi:hypothetical protein